MVYKKVHRVLTAVVLGMVPFATSCTLFAPGRGDWELLGLEGQWVTALAETDWGLFAGTRSRGVFRYDEAAGQWEPLGIDGSINRSMLFLPGTSPRLLVGLSYLATEPTEAAVFATEDGGVSWVPWDGGLAEQNDDRFWAYSLAQDPSEPDRLLMGSSFSILESTDAGVTWRFLFGSFDSNGLGFHTILVSDGNGEEIWAGGQSGLGVSVVFHSIDGGLTWDISFPGGHSVNTMVYDPVLPNRVWASLGGSVIRTDDGRSWEGSLRENVSVSRLVVVDGELFAVAREFAEGGQQNLRLFRYERRSDTWSSLNVPRVRGGISAIAGGGGSLIIGTSGSGVLRYKP